jgi:3-phosphoglycerate kinase
VELILPTDVVVADKFAPDAKTQTVSVEAIPDGWMGLDQVRGVGAGLLSSIYRRFRRACIIHCRSCAF